MKCLPPSSWARSTVLIPVLFFLLSVLWVNAGLFRVPITEDSDLAANSIQVQDAKSFQELLGNYSRWRFHHPGPAFFYLFAAGEYLFYDQLHIVPAPFNGQLLALIIVNIALLFGVIALFRTHCTSDLFVPVAISVSVLFIYTVNRTITNGALVSAWMPYVILFCFLFFATACASIAVGNLRHLPFVALSGMFLIHGHVAQLLFVGVLSAIAFCTGLVRVKALGDPREFRRYWIPFLISAAIVFVFVLPVLLDAVLNRPNNLDAIRSYLHSHREHNSLRVSVEYYLSFLKYVGNPEVVLAEETHALGATPIPEYVAGFWSIFLLLVVLAAIIRFRKRKSLHPFFRYILFQELLISALFLVWASKISGPLYNFNGFFVYSIQLLALLTLVALITEGISRKWPLALIIVAGSIVSVPILWFAPFFRNTYAGNPQVQRIVSSIPNLPAEQTPTQISFAPSDWPLAVGVANLMKRQSTEFCVSADWGFMFGQRNVCGDVLKMKMLRFGRAAEACLIPCVTLFRDSVTSAQWWSREARFQTLPLHIEVEDSLDVKENFNGSDGSRRWSRQCSDIRFLLADTFSQSPSFKIRISGGILPGRPAQVFLNGHALGTISEGGDRTVEFHAERTWFRAGDENSITFVVDKAGPVGVDPRMLGYAFTSLEISDAEFGKH